VFNVAGKGQPNVCDDGMDFKLVFGSFDGEWERRAGLPQEFPVHVICAGLGNVDGVSLYLLPT
jgi:hypothetical protein